MEFEVLALFARSPGKVMDRDHILERMKGMEWEPDIFIWATKKVWMKMTMSHNAYGHWSKRGNLPHRRFRHVLIRKLILVLFVSGLLINCIVGGFYRLMVGQEVHTALVLLILSFVFVIAFLIIKHLLSPLKKISAGVERLGQGELDYQIPVCSHDEFGDLAISFNTMSSRLATLVKAREQLLLDVSHELRSPITRIKVALEMLPEKNAKEISSIQDDLLEMEKMISEILEAARLDSAYGKLNLSEVKLHALLDEAVAHFSKSLPGVIFVGNTYDTVLSIDKNRIQKVLNNVIENALKFSQNQTRPVEASLENLDAEWSI